MGRFGAVPVAIALRHDDGRTDGELAAGIGPPYGGEERPAPLGSGERGGGQNISRGRGARFARFRSLRSLTPPLQQFRVSLGYIIKYSHWLCGVPSGIHWESLFLGTDAKNRYVLV